MTKVSNSLHNPGPASPPVHETPNESLVASSNKSQVLNFNGNSISNGGQSPYKGDQHGNQTPSIGSQNGAQLPYNGGQVPNSSLNGAQPPNGGQNGGQGSGAQNMSAPRRGRGVLQQQEPGMRVPVCGYSGEQIRWRCVSES